MLTDALCSMFQAPHDLIVSRARGPVHIMRRLSGYCVMPPGLESDQATQFTAADPGPSVTISTALEDFQTQRNRGQSPVVLFSDGLPQAYNGQERFTSQSLHRPAPLRQRDGITPWDSNAARAEGNAWSRAGTRLAARRGAGDR